MTHPFVRVVFSYVFNTRLPAARSDGIGLQFDRIPVTCTIHLPTFATAFVAPFTAVFAMSPPGTNTTIDAPNSSHAPSSPFATCDIATPDQSPIPLLRRQEKLSPFTEAVGQNPAFSRPIFRTRTIADIPMKPLKARVIIARYEAILEMFFPLAPEAVE